MCLWECDELPWKGQGARIYGGAVDLHSLQRYGHKDSDRVHEEEVTGKDGFDVFLTDDGAIMRNRESGKLVKLYDRGGVYFAKFKTKLPDAKIPDPLLFHRHG